MFGFEPAQLDVTASASPVTFDLKLQTRATLAAEPLGYARCARGTALRKGTPRSGSWRLWWGTRRFWGRPRPGWRRPRGGTPSAAAGAGPGRGGPGFQSLNLTQNTENVPNAGEVEPSPSGTVEDASGSNEAFLVNGSLSQGVQAQPGDAFGLGAGPGAFGLQAGGPGGAGNPFGIQNNPGPNGGLPSLAAGPGGGGGGGGGFGGGGGGRGGGGGFGGGGRGGGRGGRATPSQIAMSNSATASIADAAISFREACITHSATPF